MKKSHIKILFVVLVALTFLLFSCSQQAEAPVSLSIQLDPSFVTSVLQPLTNTHTTVVDYGPSELETRFVPYLRCKVTGAVYQSIEVPLTAFASDPQSDGNFPTLDPITVEFEPIALGKRIRFEVELIDATDVVFYATSTEIFSIQPNLPPQKVKLQPNSPIVLLEAAKDSFNNFYIANDIEDLTNGNMKKIPSNINFSAIPNVFYSNGSSRNETYISFGGSGVRGSGVIGFSSNSIDDKPSFTGSDSVSDINGGLDFSTGKTWSYVNASVNYGSGSDFININALNDYNLSLAMDNGEIYFGFSYKPEGSDYDTYYTYYIFKDEFPASKAGGYTPSFINSPNFSDEAIVSISLEPSSDVTPYINDFCVRDGVIYILKGNKKYVTGTGNNSFYSTNGCLLAYNANTGDLIKTYGLSDSIPVSRSDVKHLGFPVKFVAIKPQKLVIADAGFNNVNSISNPYSNVNRVFSFDLEKKILEHEADLGFSLGGGGSGYCPNLF